MRFTGKAERSLNRALQAAREMGHTYIGTEHILLGLLGESECIASGVLEAGGVSYEAVRALVRRTAGVGEPTEVTPGDMTPRAKKVIEDAAKGSSSGKGGYIGTEHLLYAILSEPDSFGYKMVTASGASVQAIRSELSVFVDPDPQRREKGRRSEIAGCQSISKYGRDLVGAAKRGEIDPVIGRETECERVMQILSRRTKNNPCLIGEPGVGKTAVVEGLAQKIADGDVPETLRGKAIVTLDIPSMIAGAKYRGEFEERMKSVMEEARRTPSVILFIDELHTIMGAGAAEGALDAANILKPALSRGDVRLIGATTVEEYRRHIEKDAALERRFQSVAVKEPSAAEAVTILRGLRDRYEAHHKIKISDAAIGAAVDLSVRYVKGRYLPDKAIDLIDESAARIRIEREGAPELRRIEELIRDAGAEKMEAVLAEDFESALAVKAAERELIEEYKRRKGESEKRDLSRRITLSPADIADTLTKWTGIPVSTLKNGEEEKLSRLEETISSAIVGQEEAVKCVCSAVKRGRVGIKDPERPAAVLLFTGPSGVGKTELAKTLARALFGSEKSLVRFDMSEFSESHSVSKLVGSPPGYVGYEDAARLTEAVRRAPYSVVLFDEIEKAHRDVRCVLLQIMDDGRLTDAVGRECDFRNTIIIMTSNVGGEKLSDAVCLGFSANADNELGEKRRKRDAYDELKKVFSPEFIGRIDEVVAFRGLGEKDLSAIDEKYLADTKRRLGKIGVEVCFDKSVADRIVSMTDAKKYGARPLRRLVTSLVDDRIADMIVSGDICRGDRVKCSFNGAELTFEKTGRAEAPPNELCTLESV